jgi:hypothetical protein
MDKERIDLLKESLKKLISNTIWFFSILLVAIFATIQGTEKISFGQFSLDTEISGWYFLSICFALSIAIIKNYNSTITIYNQIEKNENKEIAKAYLNYYPSILNPFSEQKGDLFSKFLNNCGYSIISYSPFISLMVGLLFIKLNSKMPVIGVVMFFLTTIILRTEQRIVEKKAINLICPNSAKSKRITYYFCFVTGVTMSILFQVGVI